ncbi:hypothetical protein BCF55_0094 [Hydrogenivirga caldilitoris]|uniref:Uncharacterized protein n=1 Tax=Hydrogenivirga caldilitoris TaxID=246264 RepID=A0A497XLT6_9AQUI|nr:hypothetical protein [Hydrogenivirga caldilitoris]RLJ69837.1 hypothetical protein BCF55_0094 [Hydrogenivirga caldilitoris]
MKGLAVLIALLLSLEGFLFIKHEHRDGKKHPECAICIFKSQKQVESKVEIKPKGVVLGAFYIGPPELSSLYYKQTSSYTSIRGPPTL